MSGPREYGMGTLSLSFDSLSVKIVSSGLGRVAFDLFQSSGIRVIMKSVGGKYGY